MTARSASPPPGLPAHPVLRPGVRVCRRSAGELQVGLDPRLALVLPDDAETRALLDALQHGALPRPLAAAQVSSLARLLTRGLVADGDTWLARLADAPHPEAAGSLTATVAEEGPAAAERLERRRTTAVLVDDLGLPRAATRLRDLLAQNGVGEPAAGLAAGLVVLVGGHEPDRDLLDHWLREDVPHVLLVASEGRVRVGPFVDPGATACLRCMDAHLAERNPRHGLVLRQHAEPPAGSLPEPVPADLLDVAVGLLARDVTRWADGHRPRTWSSTVHLDPTLDLAPRLWRPHPGCACSWGAVAVG